MRILLEQPDRAASHNALGVALARQGRGREAEAEFREAARLSPRLVDAPANLGVLYARQGRLDDAIGSLRQAMALDGRRPGVRAELGRVLRGRAIEMVRQNRLDEADLEFILRLVLASGSLKDLASSYGVSYPTIRARLDRLIARLQEMLSGRTVEPMAGLLADLVEKGQVTPQAARAVLELHRREAKKDKESER